MPAERAQARNLGGTAEAAFRPKAGCEAAFFNIIRPLGPFGASKAFAKSVHRQMPCRPSEAEAGGRRELG